MGNKWKEEVEMKKKADLIIAAKNIKNDKGFVHAVKHVQKITGYTLEESLNFCRSNGISK